MDSKAYRHVAFAIALVVCEFGVAGCYRSSEFSGAGPIEDSGVFTHPRFHAPLGAIPLGVAGTYRFHFSGLPNDLMDLKLRVRGYPSIHRGQLENLTTTLMAEIKDGSGRSLCLARGTSVVSGDLSKRWVLESVADESAAFWHEACCGHRYPGDTEYTIFVSVERPDPRSPNVVMDVMLEGGGFVLDL